MKYNKITSQTMIPANKYIKSIYRKPHTNAMPTDIHITMYAFLTSFTHSLAVSTISYTLNTSIRPLTVSMSLIADGSGIHILSRNADVL